jgi:AcrR family transcriptional regulator
MPTKKRAYHHGDLRRTLLEASLALITEKGLDELSLREVARRAGVSPAAPYHHFATRQELLAAIAVDGFALLAESMRTALAAVEEQGASERLCATGQGYIEFAVRHPAHFRLMFRPSLFAPGALPMEGPPREAFQILLDAVSEVLEDDNVREHIDRRGLVLVAWSLVHGAAELLLDGPFARGLDELEARADDIPRLVTRAFEGLLDAAGAQRAAAEGKGAAGEGKGRVPEGKRATRPQRRQGGPL